MSVRFTLTPKMAESNLMNFDPTRQRNEKVYKVLNVRFSKLEAKTVRL